MNKEQKLTELKSKLDKIQAEIDGLRQEQLNRKPKYPDSVEGIERRWYINSSGVTHELTSEMYCKDINNLSTQARAEAFLALMQLREIHAEMVKDYHPDDLSFFSVIVEDASYSIQFWFQNVEQVNHFDKNEKIQELVETVKIGF